MKKHQFNVNISYKNYGNINKGHFYDVETKEFKDGFLILTYCDLSESRINLDIVAIIEIEPILENKKEEN